MPVVHFDPSAHSVDQRYLWATTVDEVVARKGGAPGDYAVGDWPVGSVRDPGTGEITPYAPPALTTAELAATLSLPASDFWIALHVALIGKGALTPADDVQAHVLAAIDTGVSASMLSAIEGMAARILVRTAVTFHRADPKRPGLLDGVGGLLGLTGAEIDALFIDNAA